LRAVREGAARRAVSFDILDLTASYDELPDLSALIQNREHVDSNTSQSGVNNAAVERAERMIAQLVEFVHTNRENDSRTQESKRTMFPAYASVPDRI
jgi:hypothetical protein